MLSGLKEKLQEQGAVILKISVHPNAVKNRLKSLAADGTLRIDIAAVPEKDRANGELIGFLASEFQVSRKCISILSGTRVRKKLVKITLNGHEREK